MFGWYLDQTTPEKPGFDWSRPQARAEHLRALVDDARAALASVDPAGETSPKVARAARLLIKIVADDEEEGPPAGPKRRGRPPKEEPVALAGATSSRPSH